MELQQVATDKTACRELHGGLCPNGKEGCGWKEEEEEKEEKCMHMCMRVRMYARVQACMRAYMD